ncbi:class I SAM-dependent methyltransferase [Luteimonas mephitis]|uniref:class I SAM-dependent methyltransferase n=1 Tax=Luteimonas mephitis TaxID=83615 RepID=UPI000419552C|nr:class I SAM-dependent methyltransferase [Luteimonas mephitis]
MRHVLIACALAAGLSISIAAIARAQETAAAPAHAEVDAALQQAVAGDWRGAENTARDRYRHPAETLAFFGVKPDQTVIEITPGGGWYAEILAPLLRDKGHYIAAVVDPMAVKEGGSRDYQQKSKSGLEAKFAAAPAQFDRARVVAYDPAAPVFGAPGSADVVLTFRNVHNWRSAGQAEGMFRGFFAVLKPGGVLGVAEHRANGDVGDDDKSGYVGEQQVIAMAEAAGFKLDAKSEVNANPKDTKDYPGGVWTLPPTNKHDAEDNAKYRAIGESDRMTLRFVKP